MNDSSPAKPAVASPKTAGELLDLYWLDARSHLLETAAILDRIERADGGRDAMADPRVRLLKDACAIMTQETHNRAEHFLRHFSDNSE